MARGVPARCIYEWTRSVAPDPRPLARINLLDGDAPSSNSSSSNSGRNRERIKKEREGQRTGHEKKFEKNKTKKKNTELNKKRSSCPYSTLLWRVTSYSIRQTRRPIRGDRTSFVFLDAHAHMRDTMLRDRQARNMHSALPA